MIRTIIVIFISVGGMYWAFHRPFYGLLAYLWFAYFRAQELTWGYVSQLRLSFWLAIAIILSAFFRGEKVFLRSRLSFLLLLLWLCFLLSAIFSTVPSKSWGMFEDMSKVFIMGFLITGLVNDRKKLQITCTVIGITLGFFGVKAGIYSILHAGAQITEGPGGFASDNNSFALAQVMAIPFFYYLGHVYGGLMKRVLHYCIIFIMWCVVATYSRGGFLALAGLLGMMSLYTRGKLRYFSVVLLTTAILSWFYLPESYRARIHTIKETKEIIYEGRDYEEAGETSAMGRIHFWKVALVMFRNRPMIGMGINTYRWNYSKYDFTHGYYGKDRAVHSTYMEMLSENGLIASIIFILMLGTFFIENRKIRKMAKKFKELSWAIPYTYIFEMSMFAFCIGCAFISLAYGDIPYHIIFLVIALRHSAENELKVLRQPSLIKK